jgi:uncharacterized protein (DUF427 family)
MSLTSGRGPLSHQPRGWFDPPLPPGTVFVEPTQRRIRGVVAGRTVVESQRALLVHRAGKAPTYAFPAADVGDVDSQPEPAADGHVAVAWNAVDAWFEEEEPTLLHASNPYHRVQHLRTRRRLRVEVAGVVLVDTNDTLGVYETALAPKLYVRPDQVRTDLLEPSTTTTYCPYKGVATYWSARIDGLLDEDVGWSYEDPLPESLRLKGLLSFEPTRATVITDLPAD